MKRRSKICWLLFLPSLVGVLLFYAVPFAYSLWYAMVDSIGTQNFVGLKNFTSLLTNELFRRAAWNTVRFTVLVVPLGMVLALLLALALQKVEHSRPLIVALLLLPLVVPSGSVVYFWRVLFGDNGLILKFLLETGLTKSAASPRWGMRPLTMIFLWKNVSYNVVLFWSGLNWIPKTYYEQLRLEGGGAWASFLHITWVYLSPTTFVVLLMSIVNSFKVFKEIYMLYGGYPSPDIYMLQHYMNNQFLSLDMPTLASAAYVLFLVLGVMLLLVFKAQKRVTDLYS